MWGYLVFVLGSLVIAWSGVAVAQSSITNPGPVTPKPPASVFIWKSPVVPGDVNGDGAINIIDINLITQSFGMTPSADDPRDLNRDGIINAVDRRTAITRCSKPGCAV